MEFSYKLGQESVTVSVERADDQLRVIIGDRVYSVTARQRVPGVLDLEVDGRRLAAYVVHDDTRYYVAVAGDTWVLTRPDVKQQGQKSGFNPDMGSLEATMPGLVLDVLVCEGDEVARGETLVLLEAMKMELRITAPCAGRVRKLHCAAGEVVDRGQTLVEIEETDLPDNT